MDTAFPFFHLCIFILSFFFWDLKSWELKRCVLHFFGGGGGEDISVLYSRPRLVKNLKDGREGRF